MEKKTKLFKKQHKTIPVILQALKKHFLLFISLITVIVVVYLFLDYRGPSEVYLKPDNAFGFSCLRAKDLLVQEYDNNGNLWATRGMIVYKLKSGDNKFTRVAHVPTVFSFSWLRNFTIFRKLTIRPECVEMIVTDNGEICALSAGQIWLLPASEKEFHKTMQLSNYGIGDQGIRNDGIINIDDSTVFFGEYFQNPNRDEVKIFKSMNNMNSWKVAFEFQPGQIRHIHAVQKDPYSDKLWLCTGDFNEESMVAWSNDNFKSITQIGQGSQLWRVCQLIFTEQFVFWGTDTGSEDLAGIYRWDKNTAEMEKLQKVDGAIFYGTRLARGTIVMSTNRQGRKNEIDNKTRLFIITDENKIASFICGTWNHNKPGFWFKYAKLRFQRKQGGSALVITCLNQKEFPDGDLLIISEDTLLQVSRAKE